jgi:hypothetical protein
VYCYNRFWFFDHHGVYQEATHKKRCLKYPRIGKKSI